MKIKYKRLLFVAYLSFLILMAVFPLNSKTNTTLTDVFIINIRLDHLLHATLFIPWAILYRLTFHPVKWYEYLVLIGAGLFVAFCTEGVQYFLTYRSYNVNDLIANITGVLIGTILLLVKIPGVTAKLIEKQNASK